MVSAENLKFDAEKRRIHKATVRLLAQLKLRINRTFERTDEVYEVRNRMVTLSEGMTLPGVAKAVCKSFGLTVVPLEGNAYEVTYSGDDKERFIAVVSYDDLLFSISQRRDPRAETNGFQYIPLVKAIENTIIANANRTAYEIREHTKAQMRASEEISRALWSINYNVRSMNDSMRSIDYSRSIDKVNATPPLHEGCIHFVN